MLWRPPGPQLFPYTTLFRSWMPWHLSRLVKHIEQTGADFVHDLLAGIGPDGADWINGPPHPQMGYVRVHVPPSGRSEEHTSELQSLRHLVCRLLLEKKRIQT